MTSSLLDFTAIDFETANRARASVCAVGLVRVRHGKVVAEDSWLVIPPTGADAFDLGNIRIHGIRPQDVRRKGIDWQQSLARIEAFRGGSTLIAHNSSFDQSVFAESCRALGIVPPSARWEDTLRLARQHLSLPDYKLPTVAKHLKVRGFKHHDAAADARACAQIAIAVARQVGAVEINDLWPLQSQRTGASRWNSDRAASAKVADLPKPAADADENHPLFGQMVVVTGDLEGMDRWTAFERIAAAGGTPQKNVTLKTTMLVVASRRRLPETYRPDLGRAKEQKAAMYRDRGNAITFWGREEFAEALAWAPAAADPGQPAGHESTDPPARLDSAVKRSADETSFTAPPSVAPEPRPMPFSAPVAPEFGQGPGSAREAQQLPAVDPTARSPAGEPSGAMRAESAQSTSTARRIVGWVLLVPSALAVLLLLLTAVAGAFTSGDSVGIKIAVVIVILLMTLVPLGLGLLGAYLLGFRDRWPSLKG